MQNKKSFIVYSDWIETFAGLTDEQAGKLIKHIFQYCNDLDPVSDDAIVNVAFIPIKQQLKRDLEKWKIETGARSESGRLGGIKSGEARRSKREANEASASESKQTEANEAVKGKGLKDKGKVISDNENIENRKTDFHNSLQVYAGEFSESTINDFFTYWTEPDKKGKMRFEAQKFFDIGRRLATWKKNESKFNNGKNADGTRKDRVDMVIEASRTFVAPQDE